MKLLFENKTKYTKQSYEQFVQFHNKKYNVSYTLYTVIMTVLLIYCIIFNMTQLNIPLILLFIILLLVFLLARIYLPTQRYKQTKQVYEKNKEQYYVFSFYPHYFKIGEKGIYYFKLYKVYETDEYFYLYINEDFAALVDKKQFTVGNAEDFSKFIKKKCLFKYRKQT